MEEQTPPYDSLSIPYSFAPYEDQHLRAGPSTHSLPYSIQSGRNGAMHEIGRGGREQTTFIPMPEETVHPLPQSTTPARRAGTEHRSGMTDHKIVFRMPNSSSLNQPFAELQFEKYEQERILKPVSSSPQSSLTELQRQPELRREIFVEKITRFTVLAMLANQLLEHGFIFYPFWFRREKIERMTTNNRRAIMQPRNTNQTSLSGQVLDSKDVPFTLSKSIFLTVWSCVIYVCVLGLFSGYENAHRNHEEEVNRQFVRENPRVACPFVISEDGSAAETNTSGLPVGAQETSVSVCYGAGSFDPQRLRQSSTLNYEQMRQHQNQFVRNTEQDSRFVNQRDCTAELNYLLPQMAELILQHQQQSRFSQVLPQQQQISMGQVEMEYCDEDINRM